MNVTVYAALRALSRELPTMPCPLVHPRPIAVPTPTSAPAHAARAPLHHRRRHARVQRAEFARARPRGEQTTDEGDAPRRAIAPHEPLERAAHAEHAPGERELADRRPGRAGRRRPARDGARTRARARDIARDSDDDALESKPIRTAKRDARATREARDADVEDAVDRRRRVERVDRRRRRERDDGETGREETGIATTGRRLRAHGVGGRFARARGRADEEVRARGENASDARRRTRRGAAAGRRGGREGDDRRPTTTTTTTTDQVARTARDDRYDAYLPKTETTAQVEERISKLRGTDAFAAMLTNSETVLEELIEKAAAVKSERNRATVATLNAEVRRGKNYLRGELPKLRKVARAKSAGTTEEDVRAMLEIVDNLEDRVEAVADGVTRGLPPQKKKPAGGFGGTSTVVNISSGADPGSSANPFLNMEQSEASEAFRQEFEARKAKQDKGLDVISRGLGVLKDIGGEMQEEMRRQQPITDAIEDKLDSVNADMRTANSRLKEAVTKIRSTRKFCMDAILILVILGVSLTIYKTVA